MGSSDRTKLSQKGSRLERSQAFASDDPGELEKAAGLSWRSLRPFIGSEYRDISEICGFVQTTAVK